MTETEIIPRLNSQKTPHTSPSRASYGVSFLMIWEKIDRVITEPHCTICTTIRGRILRPNGQVMWHFSLAPRRKFISRYRDRIVLTRQVIWRSRSLEVKPTEVTIKRRCCGRDIHAGLTGHLRNFLMMLGLKYVMKISQVLPPLVRGNHCFFGTSPIRYLSLVHNLF